MNQLFFGDNLDVLRESIKDESVDLVYLDPPFNSNRDYNQIFKAPDGSNSHAQIEAFDDTWHWGDEAELEFDEIIHSGNTDIADLIDAFSHFLGKNDLLAYLVMMANRLMELHRVLKPTGTLYLHCDSNASHYLKLVLDAVFNVSGYTNEIIWKRTSAHGDTAQGATHLGRSHDSILLYKKSDAATWNPIYTEHSPEYVKSHYPHTEVETGRRYGLFDITGPGGAAKGNPSYEIFGVTKYWRYSKVKMDEKIASGKVIQPSPGSIPREKRYLDESGGVPLGDVWTDISPINSQAQERLGYPTQKPLALLERIISVSTNPGDTVLDPFCGCGTAVDAAQKLGRQWIGIDITHLAISLIEKRLKDRYKGIPFEIHGTPKDLEGAQNLAERDKFQFEWWACSLVDAVPFKGKKKGADSGIDGVIYFSDAENGDAVNRRIIVSVKGGGNPNVSMIRDLKGTMEREGAPIGIFVTLTEPTKPMKEEAAKSGFYHGGNGKDYHRVQILTIAELLEHHKRPEFPDMTMGSISFKKAKPQKVKDGEMTPLF